MNFDGGDLGQGPPEKCPVCKGTGVTVGDKITEVIPCNNCDGTGEIYSFCGANVG